MSVWNLNTVAGSTDREVDPVSRIEGHLGVKVRVGSDGFIKDANAHGNLWRGFENFLLGRGANDAITFVQRICGVCPVPHGLTSTYAVDSVLGYSRSHITFSTLNEAVGSPYGIPPKALLIRNLVLSAEFLMSSITHFYHLAAPSYVQGPNMPPWTPYFAEAFYNPVLRSSFSADTVSATAGVVPVANTATMQIWDAVIISYVRALRIRRLTFEAGALFAGRMPMTSCFVGGGVTNDGTENLTQRCNKYEEIIQEVGKFIVNEYVPIALVLGFLYPGFDNDHNKTRSFFYTPGDPVGFGAGLGRFLVWGQFPELNDDLAIKGGVLELGAPAGVYNFTVANKGEVISKFLSGALSVPTNLTEDISNSRYVPYVDDAAVYATTASRPFAGAEATYPGDITRTKPARDDGYSYMKAPRWAGKPCEVGPMADMFVNGYFQDGVDLATSIPTSATVSGYDLYVKAGGLDLDIIAPTIVNGIVNSGKFLFGVDPVAYPFGADGMGLVAAIQTWVLGIQAGLSTMDRLRARALQSFVLVQRMIGKISKSDGSVTPLGTLSFGSSSWINQLKSYTGAGVNANDTVGSTWANKSIPTGIKKGWGAGQAPRGSLMHQITINNGKITAYQCIVPTTWNGSPKDVLGQNGAIEKACIGAPFATGATYTKTITGQGGASIPTVGGVEVARIAQSFDPCIACAIH
ncbi:MAG TPA: nickel-dependent hydrogenase large subunit [Coriobacteriia bacterium]|nr:nickel-dependent hydrogenase large subunit [Coriobacteriia bacterium]